MIRLRVVQVLLLIICHQFAQATFAKVLEEREPATCVDSCSKRTLFDIVWACVSTTIICAWISIHPNLPPREGGLMTTLRRLELMFWTIVAPEILPVWAVKQRLAASMVAKVYNDSKGVLHKFWKTNMQLIVIHQDLPRIQPGQRLNDGFHCKKSSFL